MPPKAQQRPMAKPKNTLGALKRIFSYMHGFRVQFIFVVLGIFFSYCHTVIVYHFSFAFQQP